MMLTGLDILLDRMKTNPEEFLNAGEVPYEGELFGGKWADLIRYAWRVGTEEERKMLEDAQIQFYRDDFNGRVMKRLAGEDRSDVEEIMRVSVDRNPKASPHWTDPRMAMQNAVLQGNGYGQAQVRQEGAAISVDPSFGGGITGRFWR